MITIFIIIIIIIIIIKKQETEFGEQFMGDNSNRCSFPDRIILGSGTCFDSIVPKNQKIKINLMNAGLFRILHSIIYVEQPITTRECISFKQK